jgi:hypothetical protein
LERRLINILFCEKIVVVKSREVKTGWSNSRHTWRDQVRNSVVKRDCFANDDDDNDNNDGKITKSDIDSDKQI